MLQCDVLVVSRRGFWQTRSSCGRLFCTKRIVSWSVLAFRQQPVSCPQAAFYCHEIQLLSRKFANLPGCRSSPFGRSNPHTGFPGCFFFDGVPPHSVGKRLPRRRIQHAFHLKKRALHRSSKRLEPSFQRKRRPVTLGHCGGASFLARYPPGNQPFATHSGRAFRHILGNRHQCEPILSSFSMEKVSLNWFVLWRFLGIHVKTAHAIGMLLPPCQCAPNSVSECCHGASRPFLFQRPLVIVDTFCEQLSLCAVHDSAFDFITFSSICEPDFLLKGLLVDVWNVIKVYVDCEFRNRRRSFDERPVPLALVLTAVSHLSTRLRIIFDNSHTFLTVLFFAVVVARRTFSDR